MPRLRARFEFPQIPCSSEKIPCSCSQGICCYHGGKAGDSWPRFAQGSPNSEKFPVFSLFNRDEAAETLHSNLGIDREKPAIPRGFGKIGFLKRTGDGGFGARTKPLNAFFSTAKLNGSLSLSIRPSLRQLNPSAPRCSAQSNGRSILFVSSSVVRSTG